MKFDLVVGIPSYNEADSISFVVKQVDLGIQKYFKGKKCVIINVDNDSLDNTKQAFLDTETVTPKKYISTPKGIKGKGRNFYNLFKFVVKNKAQTVVVVDADLKSITPLWIKHLANPIIKGYDMVCPRYNRSKYDATISNNITFPLVYGLLYRNIRQPTAGDFAFSQRLCQYWLEQEWTDSVKNFGIDIFMTTKAILGDFKIAQVNLGEKIHKPSAPKLGPMFLQVTETLFDVLIDNYPKWRTAKKVQTPKIFDGKKPLKFQRLVVNSKKIKKEIIKNYNREEVRKYLSEDNFLIIDTLFANKAFYIHSQLWVEIMYDFIIAFSQAKNKEAVIEAMQSLFFARVFSFIEKVKGCSQEKAEKEIQRQAELFIRNRDYLIKRLDDIIA